MFGVERRTETEQSIGYPRADNRRSILALVTFGGKAWRNLSGMFVEE